MADGSESSDGERETARAPERVKSWGQALFGSGLLSGFFAIISGFAALWSGWWATEADRALKQYQSDRQEQLVIYERVEKHLAAATPTGIVIASSYVRLVKDPMIGKALCETIAAVARSKLDSAAPEAKLQLEAALGDVARMMKECSISLGEGQVLAEAATGDGKPVSVQETRQNVAEAAPVQRIVSSAAASSTGWDIDVFWCESRGKPSEELARKTADRLAQLSNQGAQVGGEQLGRIRLRSVNAQAESKLTPGGGNRVWGADNEAEFARGVVADLNQNVEPTFRYARTGATTSWYLSVFTCGFPA